MLEYVLNQEILQQELRFGFQSYQEYQMKDCLRQILREMHGLAI
jgi:hypothetical protein